MGRKRVLRIAKIATITCINCGAKSKRRVPLDSSPQYFDCDKCGKRILTPVSKCCVICAFTNKKCIPSLKMEAKIRGLEIK